MKKFLQILAKAKSLRHTLLAPAADESRLRRRIRLAVEALLRYADQLFKGTGFFADRFLRAFFLAASFFILLVLFSKIFYPDLWNLIVLPIYGKVLFNVTSLPAVAVILFAFTYRTLYLNIKKSQNDPVRENDAGQFVAFVLLLIFAVAALAVFNDSWEFFSWPMPWLNRGMAFLNMIGAALLIYIFRMGWNKGKNREKIHRAHVATVGKSKRWNKLPKYIQKKLREGGWRNSSSIYANSIYSEFIACYKNALDALLADFLGGQSPQPQKREQPTSALVEEGLKFGYALASYCELFNDVNGHRALLAHEIAWRILNLKILEIKCLVTAAPQFTKLEAPLEELGELIKNYYKFDVLLEKSGLEPPADEDAPEKESGRKALFKWSGEWRSRTLRNRLGQLFLSATHFNSAMIIQQTTAWLDKWQKEKFAIPDRLKNLAEQLAGIAQRLEKHEKLGTDFSLPKYRLRQIAVESGLDFQNIPFLRTKKEITDLIKKEKLKAVRMTSAGKKILEDEKLTEAQKRAELELLALQYKFDFAEDLQCVNGFKPAGLDDDLTRLLLALPVLRAADIKGANFLLMWATALLFWLFEDFLFFERDISGLHFKEIWDSLDPHEFPVEIKPALLQLLSSPLARKRWLENQMALAKNMPEGYFKFWLAQEELIPV